MSKAIGLIETNGLVAAIEALDAALKAANVTLQSKELTDGGWVMMTVTGDVGSVTAAIDAASAAADRVGQLISAHVIPRLSDEVFALVAPVIQAKPVVTKEVIDVKEADEEPEAEIEVLVVKSEKKEVDALESFAKDDLEHMKVIQLRQLARQLNLHTIERSLIKFANKEELIKAIRDHMKGGNL
ncbi:BMC domain-containing protein [Fusibacter bizertensis]